jgi:hypothetical protein
MLHDIFITVTIRHARIAMLFAETSYDGLIFFSSTFTFSSSADTATPRRLPQHNSPASADFIRTHSRAKLTQKPEAQLAKQHPFKYSVHCS